MDSATKTSGHGEVTASTHQSQSADARLTDRERPENTTDHTLPLTDNTQIPSSLVDHWEDGENSFVCSHCDMTFTRKTDLRSHMRCHGIKLKRPMEPEGELWEDEQLSTAEFTVMVDSESTKWYQCRKCPMVGSRRFRMTSHFKASHSENGGVPFSLLENKDSEGVSQVGENTEGHQDEVQICDVDIASSIRDETMTKPKSIVSRLQQNHPERITEECEKCGYKTSAEGLRSHMRIKHSKYLYSCNVCNKTFSTLFLLKNHYKKHFGSNGDLKNGADATIFQCSKCGKKFGRKVDLVHHIKLGSSCSDKPPDPSKYNPLYADGRFVCEVCGYTAKQRTHVVQHHARKHAPKEFPCTQCTKTFAYETDLANHQNVSHVAVKAHKCEVCGKSFASAKYLMAHQMRHDQIKRHFCPVCDKGFLAKYRLEKHVETHKTRDERTLLYYCTICSKAFTSDSYRKDHENIHKGTEPYECKICGKTMKAQSAVWKHMQYHNSEKQHTCPIERCKKRFRFKAGLTAHMVTHTKEGKHRCERCGKVYTQRQTLLRHVCKTPITPQIPSFTDEDQSSSLTTDPMDISQLGSPQAQSVYMCSECNKLFHSWEEINKHMLLHTTGIENVQSQLEEALVEDHDNLMVQVHVLEMTDTQAGPGETGPAVLNILSPELSVKDNQHIQTSTIAYTSIQDQDLQISTIADTSHEISDITNVQEISDITNGQEISDITNGQEISDITNVQVHDQDLQASNIVVTTIENQDLQAIPDTSIIADTCNIADSSMGGQTLQTTDMAGTSGQEEVYSMMVEVVPEQDKQETSLVETTSVPVGFTVDNPPITQANESLDFDQRQIEIIQQVTLTEPLQ